MTNTTTTLDNKDGLVGRRITVEHEYAGSYITLGTDTGGSVCAVLKGNSKAKLIEALAGDNATVVTGLPEAYLDGYGFITAGGYDRGVHADPAELLKHGKALLAMSAFLTKHKEEQAAARKAEEEATKAAAEAKSKRRDELAAELSGCGGSYTSRTSTFKAAIDRIIELEEAAKVS